MTRLMLLPGDLVCKLVGLTQENEHKQMLRIFANTLVWGAIGVAIVLKASI